MPLTMEVFPGNSVGLCLHNILPGLESLISDEISIELDNVLDEQVHSFLHLVPFLLGSVKCCLSYND